MSEEVNTTPPVEEPKVSSVPLYPLIEFPEGVDLKDFYVQVRVGMVVAHVCFYGVKVLTLELDASRSQFFTLAGNGSSK